MLKQPQIATAIIFLGALSSGLHAATLQVGPGKTFEKPCAAIAAAAPGDTILIDAAGSYSGDVCLWSKNALTLRGVNGRPRIDAGGRNAAGKGIWVIDGNDTVVENIEFSGATVPDGNGAGIRLEAPNLTVRRSYFHHNQAGLLTNNPGTGQVLIEYSEFGFNGTGNGYTHNVYIGQIAKLVFRHNYSHDANGGQLVKSRAAESHILYNRLSTETGTSSYEIDISNGGLTYAIGNVVVQGASGQNSTLLIYGAEGAHPLTTDNRLFVVNNTFVNRMSYAYFISDRASTPAVVKNNIFAGPGTPWTQSSTAASNNILTNVDPKFVNPAAYDFRLQATSPAINAGVAPGTGGAMSLSPAFEYVHPACGQTRTDVGAIDIGAFEYGNAGTPVNCSGATPAAASLTGVFLSASAVTAGQSVSGTVQLSGAAPAGGALVALSSSNGAAAAGPSSVVVGEGASAAGFPVTTGAVAAPATVTITASHADANRSASLTVNPYPLISGVSTRNVAASTATIVWTTNVPATTEVIYGPTTAYGSASGLDSTKVTTHSVTLSGLSPSTVYHYRALSVDACGEQAQSADLTFTTPRVRKHSRNARYSEAGLATGD